MYIVRSCLLLGTLFIASTPLASQQQTIKAIHSCNNVTAMQQSMCNSSYQFSIDIVNTLKNELISYEDDVSAAIIPSYHAFTFYNHLPNPLDQTALLCSNAFMNTTDKPYGAQGGGQPLCNLINYVQSVGEPYKQTNQFFTSLLQYSTVSKLPSKNSAFENTVNSLGAQAANEFTEADNYTNQYYIPVVPYHTDKLTQSNYYGMSGGGGSGAGFELKIKYKQQCLHNSNRTQLNNLGLNTSNCTKDDNSLNNCVITVYSGGFGGGGGMTSPDSNNQKLYIGAGGGGGAQFNINQNQSSSIGAGMGAQNAQPQYSISNQAVYLKYLNSETFQDNYLFPGCVKYFIVEGGGGMGAGFELLPKSNTLSETPIYSSGAGFQFTHIIKPLTSIEAEELPLAQINRSVTNFYQSSGTYWKLASQPKITFKLKQVCKGGWNQCPICMTNLQAISIYCMAMNPSQWHITGSPTLSYDNIRPYMFMNFLTAKDSSSQCNRTIANFTKSNYPNNASLQQVCNIINQGGK